MQAAIVVDPITVPIWNCWFYCDSGQSFLFEEKAICGVTSGQRVVSLLTEVSQDEAKMKDLPYARRETRKRIASFKKTKYDFSL